MIRERNLPTEIIQKISSFCTVEKVKQEMVTSICASSSDNRHPLKESLTVNKNTWWISANISCGGEYVEYELSPRLCRLSEFHILIPPLPAGPLSVRKLRLDCMDPNSGAWVAASPVWIIKNRADFQEFQLDPPVDTRFCRVICLSNQISHIFYDEMLHVFNSVGYYCVRFK
jgi:hypothetical protein